MVLDDMPEMQQQCIIKHTKKPDRPDRPDRSDNMHD